MLKRVLAVTFALVLMLTTGCVGRQAEEAVVVYRLSEDTERFGSAALVEESFRLPGNQTALDAAVYELNTEPADSGMKKAFPEGSKILSCTLYKGTARVSVNWNYAQMTGLDRTLSDCALAYTFLRLDEVLQVDIIFENNTLASGLTAENAMLFDGNYETGERLVKLFLPKADGSGLESKTVLVEDDGTAAYVQLAANALLDQLRDIAQATEVISVEQANGLCTLNLSEEFFTTEPEKSEDAMLDLFAIVDTLTLAQGVEAVTVKVNGIPVSGYGGYLPTWPMSFDASRIIY